MREDFCFRFIVVRRILYKLMFSFVASGEVNEKINLESFSAVFFFLTRVNLYRILYVTRENIKKSMNILEVRFVIKDMLVLLRCIMML